MNFSIKTGYRQQGPEKAREKGKATNIPEKQFHPFNPPLTSQQINI